MKQKTKRRIQGSISVLLVIILLPSMVLTALMVDSARINMARAMVSSAGDLALNTTLANYDTILKDVYGLFAMSQLENKSEEQLSEDIKAYFVDTLVSYGVVNEREADDYVGNLMGDFNELLTIGTNVEVSNFMNMEVGDFKVIKQENSGLDNPEILRKQIVDYMKYRGPVNFGLGFLDSLKAFTTIEEQSKVVEAQVAAQEMIQPVTEGCRATIQAIREYDAKVEAMETDTEKAVKGKDNSKDNIIVKIVDSENQEGYASQLDKYKSVWGENYEDINRMNLVFLVKSVDISDKYLVKKSYAVGKFYVLEHKLDSTDSGISVSVSLASDFESAKSQTEALKNILDAENGQYAQLKNYSSAGFLERTLINTEKTAFTDKGNAMDAYVKFEGFLLNDSTLSPNYSYAKIAEGLEALETYQKYHNNYMDKFDGKITEAQAELTTRQGEEASKKSEMDKAKGELDAAKEKKQQVENAQSNATSKESAYNTAVKNLQDTKAPANSDTYKHLQEAVEKAKQEWDDAKAAYDAIKDSKPSDAEIQALENAYKSAENAYKTAQNNTQAANQALEKVKSEKNLAVAGFEETISEYSNGVRQYQHDLELYVDYQNVAKKEIAEEAKAIKEQFSKIESNITELEADLNLIGNLLSQLKLYVEEYNTGVDAWNQANTDYVAANSSDSFSKQNEADISLTDSQYNIDSLITLKTYVEAIAQEFRDFLDYIQTPGRYQYGTVRLSNLETADAVKGAVSAEIVNTLGDIVTVQKADGVFNTLYHGADGDKTPTIEIEQLCFVKGQVLPIQFLKYLNENFPEEAQNLTLNSETGTGESTDPEGEYDKVKNEMKGDKNGNEAIDDTDGDTYGYTFININSINKTGLPSKGMKEDSNENSSITLEDGDNDSVKVSGGLQNQNANLGSALNGIGNVLETGLENVYIVDYIFENFSYNTLVQEMMVEGEGIKDYPTVLSKSSDASVIGQYKGKAKTLSNYNISATNNYLYGAEIEYILFGSSTPSQNVTYTKAGIYAIRFGFNAVFAFTDSEIRNTTRAVGLAVQAATCGFVPYQVVQIVLQLAIAAAESAIDLDMMSKGLDVVVVKTRETWTLSVKGVGGFLSDAATAVVDKVVADAVGYINEGITDVLDASAEELGDAVNGLTDTVEKATMSKGQEIVDAVFAELESDLDELLNKIQYMSFADYDNTNGGFTFMDKAEAKAQVEAMFEQVKIKVNGYTSKFTGNPIAEALVPDVVKDITATDGIIEQQKQQILQIIDTAPDSDIGGAICEQMLQIKYDLITKMQEAIKKTAKHVSKATQEGIDEMTSYLTEQASACTEEMVEELAVQIKENVSGKLNEFSEKYLNDAGASKVDLGKGGGGEGKTTGSGVASMIKFGYKDYLMLFVFIAVCADDTAVLGRVGDLIQLNFSFDRKDIKEDAAGQVLISHKKGKDFKLSDAKTYVSIRSDVQLDMLFLDMDFFNRLLVDEEEDVDSILDAATKISYKGMAGY